MCRPSFSVDCDDASSEWVCADATGGANEIFHAPPPPHRDPPPPALKKSAARVHAPDLDDVPSGNRVAFS